jgi:hypothetical protein
MKRLLRLPINIFILSGLLISMTAKADFWDNPRVKTYYSENKEFKLVITPKMTSDKYYLWYYYKSNKHPQTKKILRKKEKFIRNISEHDTIRIPCTGELYQINGTDSVLIWKRPFLNEVCPVYAIVSNDGSSIATFDNWYSIGYGVNVLVVYDNKGNARKTYKLEEISPFPLNDYSMSISSLYWRKDVRYIDNDRIEIIFETDDNKTTKRIYN